jgi:HEAT repeat protein
MVVRGPQTHPGPVCVTMSYMRAIVLLAITATAFGQMPDKAYDTLKAGLEDSNPAKRIAAVLALGVARPEPKPVALVVGMLADKDSGTRAAACSTLGDMKARTAIPKLRTALDDKAGEVIFAAGKALFAMGDPQGREVLIEVLVGDQAPKSGVVSSSLRDAKLKLHDPKALLLLGVNESAGLLGPFGASVPIAEMLMKDNQASGKTAAALLLATDHSEDTRKAVKEALNDKNWTVRVAAIRSAAMLDLTSDYADMVALLEDKRDEVRYAAAGAMIRLKQKAPAKR